MSSSNVFDLRTLTGMSGCEAAKGRNIGLTCRRRPAVPLARPSCSPPSCRWSRGSGSRRSCPPRLRCRRWQTRSHGDDLSLCRRPTWSLSPVQGRLVVEKEIVFHIPFYVPCWTVQSRPLCPPGLWLRKARPQISSSSASPASRSSEV